MEKAREKELVTLAQNGSQEAFKELFEVYYARAYNFAYQIMRNANDAEEVLQESFVKAWLNLKGFKGDSSFYTWFYRIIRNMAIDVKRKLSRRIQASPEEPDASRISNDDGHLSATSVSPEESYSNKQSLVSLEKALALLKEEQRSILILREIDGFSYEEIASICGLNSGTVMSRLFYARKALHEALLDVENLTDKSKLVE